MTHGEAFGWVAVGSGCGALARWGILTLVVAPGSDLAVLILNAVGSVLLGVVLGLGPPEPGARSRVNAMLERRVRLGLGVGFCGGLTTFSTFAVNTAERLHSHQFLEAATGVAATTLLSTLGSAAGFWAIRRR